MKANGDVKREIVFGAFILVPVSVIIIAGVKYPDFRWIGLISVILIGAFGQRLYQWLNGERIDWDQFTTKDKTLYFVSTTILLSSFGLAYREEISLVIALILVLSGWLLQWLIIYLLGSEIAKDKLLWPKPKQKRPTT